VQVRSYQENDQQFYCACLIPKAEISEDYSGLEEAAEKSPIGVVFTDDLSCIEHANPAFCAITGYRSDELKGRNIRLIQSGETDDSIYDLLHDRLKKGESWSGILHNRRKNHSTYWQKTSISPVMNRDNQLVRCVAFCEDITEKRLAQEELRKQQDRLEELVAERNRHLREAETRFRSIVDNIPGGFVYRCVLDEHWTMQFISGSVKNVTGYPASDFVENITRTYASIIHPDDQAMVEKVVVAGVEALKPYAIEYRIVCKDGTVKMVRENGQAIKDSLGNVLWLDGTILDLTEFQAK